MKKLGYLLFVILILITVNVKADDNCDSKELARLKELAKKIEFDYDYKLVDEKAVFSINAVNLNEDLKVLIIKDYYSDNYREFKNNSEHKATLDNFSSGERIVVTIKGFVPNWCSGKTVLTKTIKLPYYNYYYDEEKCNGNEDFKYCKILINSNISEKEFNKQFELYLKNKEAKNTPSNEVSKNNTSLYLMIAGGVLLVAMIIILVNAIIKRRKKNML